MKSMQLNQRVLLRKVGMPICITNRFRYGVVTPNQVGGNRNQILGLVDNYSDL